MPRKSQWSAYRRFYVAERLARGDSQTAIAADLGVSRGALSQAVIRYDLTKAMFCKTCGEQLLLDGKCRHCAFEEWDAARREAWLGRARRG